jgi:hypothetical protein
MPNSSNNSNDPIANLRALPAPVQDLAASAKTLRRARALFLRQHADPTAARFASIGRLYLRAEPILVGSIAVVYLGWACDTLASLWR